MMDVQLQFQCVTTTLQVTGCHFGIKPPGWVYPNHHHHLFELLYCMEGEIEHTVGRESVHLTKGDWLLINSGIKHQMVNTSESYFGFFNVHFDIDDKDIRRLLGGSPYKHLSSDAVESSKLAAHVRELEHLMSQGLLHGKVQNHPNGGRRIWLTHRSKIYMQAITLLVIQEILLITQDYSGTAAPAGHASSFTTDVAHAIEERLSRCVHGHISVEDIAKELNMSRGQCSKVFSKIYGVSPRQYISQLKLNRAKELLVKTHLTVEKIAEELGFQSASMFSRQFRRWTGSSPNQFRPKYAMSMAKEIDLPEAQQF